MNIDSVDQELIKSEYEVLRSEIDTAKDRLFKLFISGITLPLVIIAVIVKFHEASAPIAFALPILLLSMYFRYEYERKVIYRAGNYIREVLEPNSGGQLGWETWLKNGTDIHVPSKLCEGQRGHSGGTNCKKTYRYQSNKSMVLHWQPQSIWFLKKSSVSAGS